MQINMPEADVILGYAAIGRAFFKDVLSVDFDAATFGDDTPLSAFSFSGWKAPAEEGVTLNQLYKLWDEFILGRIQEVYGISIPSTSVTLAVLFATIEATECQRLH